MCGSLANSKKIEGWWDWIWCYQSSFKEKKNGGKCHMLLLYVRHILAFYVFCLIQLVCLFLLQYAGCVGTALDACHVQCFVRECRCLKLNHLERDIFGWKPTNHHNMTVLWGVTRTYKLRISKDFLLFTTREYLHWNHVWKKVNNNKEHPDQKLERMLLQGQVGHWRLCHLPPYWSAANGHQALTLAVSFFCHLPLICLCVAFRALLCLLCASLCVFEILRSSEKP